MDLEAELARFEFEIEREKQRSLIRALAPPANPSYNASLNTYSTHSYTVQQNPTMMTNGSSFASSQPSMVLPQSMHQQMSMGSYGTPVIQPPSQSYNYQMQGYTPPVLIPPQLSSQSSKEKKKLRKHFDDSNAVPRKAAGSCWYDPNLKEWPENDFRIFVGDLGNEVNDDMLTKTFSRYPSFNKAKVVRDSRSSKTKGYGFVSFSDADDFARALKELDGTYIGNRPCKLKKSLWKMKNDPNPRKRNKGKGMKKGEVKITGSVLHK